MFRRPTKEINSEFPAQERYLDSIQRITREACVTAGMSRKQVSAIQLAIEEGATNIIRHAYMYEDGTIRLRIVIYKKLIVFSLIDTGKSFQPPGESSFDLNRLIETGRRGGLGFYMIQKIMDSVEYISSGGINELRMFKRLEPESGNASPLLRRMFNLRVRFSFWTFCVVSSIIFIALYFVYSQTSAQLRRNLDETAIALTTTIAGQAAGYIINSRSDVEFDELVVSYTSANPGLTRVILVDSAGLILAHSEDINRIRSEFDPPENFDSRLSGMVQTIVIDGNITNILSIPITAGQRQLGSVQVVFSSDTLDENLYQARVKTALLTAILIAIGLVGIYLLSNYFVTPIIKITQRVRRFSSGDLESELPLEGAEEFFEISRALNEMITRLSRDRQNVIERERMAKEIEVASQIQKTLLPSKLPELPNLELDAFYRAALVVSGDLYDLIEIGEGRYCFIVADVSGKGVPASMVMSILRTVIRIKSMNAVSARDILIEVNEYLEPNIPAGIFVTVQLAIFDSKSGHMRMVSAGHNPMVYYHSDDGTLEEINPAGMPLGIPGTLETSFSERLEEMTIQVKQGDSFLFYTDGITEAVNREGKQFGTERLNEFLLEKLKQEEKPSIAEISKDLVARVDSFIGFNKQHDDITFILARSTEKYSDNKSPDNDTDIESQNIN